MAKKMTEDEKNKKAQEIKEQEDKYDITKYPALYTKEDVIASGFTDWAVGVTKVDSTLATISVEYPVFNHKCEPENFDMDMAILWLSAFKRNGIELDLNSKEIVVDIPIEVVKEVSSLAQRIEKMHIEDNQNAHVAIGIETAYNKSEFYHYAQSVEKLSEDVTVQASRFRFIMYKDDLYPESIDTLYYIGWLAKKMGDANHEVIEEMEIDHLLPEKCYWNSEGQPQPADLIDSFRIGFIIGGRMPVLTESRFAPHLKDCLSFIREF